MLQDVRKLRCRIAQVPLQLIICFNLLRLNFEIQKNERTWIKRSIGQVALIKYLYNVG